MTSERESIRGRVCSLVEGRPVRWADERTTLGDFAGREWTLEIFDVPEDQQRELLARLWGLKELVWEQLHKSLTFIFHTPAETDRLYGWVRTVSS